MDYFLKENEILHKKHECHNQSKEIKLEVLMVLKMSKVVIWIVT
jgi:hypothetical protein